MSRFSLIGMLLLAVFALGAVAASTAQAEEAPFWSIEGTRLAAGETHFISAKVYREGEEGHELKLITPEEGITVSCAGLTLPFQTGVILGSAAETPGTNGEVVRFTHCTVTGNGEKCTVENKEFTTLPLRSELVENLNEAGNGPGKELFIEFFPVTGTKVAVLKFKEEVGGKCRFKETQVSGSLAAFVLNSKGEHVELPNKLEQGTTWLIAFPTPAIGFVWLVKAGVGRVAEVGPLTAFGDPSEEEGTALVLLAKVTGTTLESELLTKWSPLP
jgi:hypothetical protein